MSYTLGILKEGKTPPDERVPLSPNQCKQLLEANENLAIWVQPSSVRRFKDSEYEAIGATLKEGLAGCDTIISVKEVPMNMLLNGHQHFFFSHTIKEQPYNRELLQTIMSKQVSLVDWECLTNDKGTRLIGFGRYAGIVGAYNAFYAWGKRTGDFDLKRAYKCDDQTEVSEELKNVKLPQNFKIVLTGRGRVGSGAKEILDELEIKRVDIDEFLNEDFDQPVYTQIGVRQYFKRKDNQPVTISELDANPDDFETDFLKFAEVSDMFIAGHYYEQGSPFLFTREQAKAASFNVKCIADISCDIDGPVASTIRPSTIADPVYGYDPDSESEVAANEPKSITVMAVDNLPCELPKDASADFGNEFVNKIFPHLINGDSEGVIANATITKGGDLTEGFEYLRGYVAG